MNVNTVNNKLALIHSLKKLNILALSLKVTTMVKKKA